jgi:hypothetical protein
VIVTLLFTDVAFTRPFAPSTITSPSIDSAETRLAGARIVMSPRTVAALTSLWVPSTVMNA